MVESDMQRIVIGVGDTAERGDVRGECGEPVGLVPAEVADAPQMTGAVGEQRHRRDGRGELTDIVQIDIDAAQPIRAREGEPVACVGRGGLAGVAGAEEGGVQPVTGPVAGEDAPGAVAAVRRGRQTHDNDTRLLVAVGRNRPAPVRLICE